MSFQLKFADIGEGLHEAEIIKWFVSEGDQVKMDEPIVEVQTDKAAVEITSPKEGRITSRNGQEGDTIFVGETIVEIALENEKSSPNNQTQVEREGQRVNRELSSTGPRVKAAPSIRKMARDMGLNLQDIHKAIGGERITKEAVLQYADSMKEKNRVAGTKGTVAIKETADHQAIKRIPIRGLRKQIYKNMVKSAFTIPHATGMDEINVERLIALKDSLNQSSNCKITFLPIIVKLLSEVLKNNPIFNAMIDEDKEEIVFNEEYNIGIAMATPQGLVVPVIHQVDRKSIEEIAQALQNLQEKAIAGKLALEELRGGTFTISNTGANGGFYATPIINHPQVAILGVHSIKEKPVILPNRELGIGHVMGISLSFDHRIIDGEPAGKFMRDLSSYIDHPELYFLKAR
ncbi:MULTISPECIES: dihydrolipoamide acetyltransferase family protein [Sporosarcina]|uniref:Dihydrolipoamide acetyltransferase component of pyruvate dehydrogenase complex n=1 Tax=Sporosarcina contaminans TaxID=633403 RepID=A0ABW3U2Z1_9BACL